MIYLIGGLPASGKSTFAKKLNLPIIEFDEYISKKYNLPIKEAYQKFTEKDFFDFIDFCSKNDNCVVVDIFTDLKSRSFIIKASKKYNHNISMYFLNTPLDICLYRNSKRKNYVEEPIIFLYNLFLKLPSKLEGFLDVCIIN